MRGVPASGRAPWSAELDHALREERVDVVLGRGIPDRDMYARETLRSEPLAVVLGEGHPLAARGANSLSPSAGALIAVARRLAVGDSWAPSH